MVRVRKLQKEKDAAVAKLFRNKLPAGSSKLSDPTEEKIDNVFQDGDADVQDEGVMNQNDVPPRASEPNQEVTTPQFLGIIGWIVSIIQMILSSVGLTVAGEKRAQQRQA